MEHRPEIAILDSNTLCCVGLQALIGRMIPQATVRTFNHFEELVCDTPDMYFHYFISSQALLEHTAFFRERRHKTIVLTSGAPAGPQFAEFRSLNVHLPEEALTRALLKMQQSAHRHGRHLPAELTPDNPAKHAPQREPNGLSPREVEVLVLIVRGFINKEIAEKLNISVTTVISHRKNITEKLNIRSVAGLTIYAVMNGYIEADRI